MRAAVKTAAVILINRGYVIVIIRSDKGGYKRILIGCGLSVRNDQDIVALTGGSDRIIIISPEHACITRKSISGAVRGPSLDRLIQDIAYPDNITAGIFRVISPLVRLYIIGRRIPGNSGIICRTRGSGIRGPCDHGTVEIPIAVLNHI